MCRHRRPANESRHLTTLTLRLDRQSRPGCRRSTCRRPYARWFGRCCRGRAAGTTDLLARSPTCRPSCRAPPDRKLYRVHCRRRRTEYLSNEAHDQQTLDVGRRRDRTHLSMTSCRLPLTSLTQHAINISRRCRHHARTSQNYAIRRAARDAR